MSKSLRGTGVSESFKAFGIKVFMRRCGATEVTSPHKGDSQCRPEGLLRAHCQEGGHGPLLTRQRFCPRAHQKTGAQRREMMPKILRRYENLTHFRPLGVRSVCGGCPACGLSAGSWRVAGLLRLVFVGF